MPWLLPQLYGNIGTNKQYEEAVTEVCGLLDVKEEAFNSDQELLEAAGDVPSPISPTVETHDPNVENLALFGCSCCNRLAERFLRSDWRVAAHWCALARQLECGGTGDRWAMARFKRLFNAAEAMRLAGKGWRSREAGCNPPAPSIAKMLGRL